MNTLILMAVVVTTVIHHVEGDVTEGTLDELENIIKLYHRVKQFESHKDAGVKQFESQKDAGVANDLSTNGKVAENIKDEHHEEKLLTTTYRDNSRRGHFVDVRGRRCARRCQAVREKCFRSAKGDDSGICMRIYNKCVPACFYHSKDGVVEGATTFECSRVCLAKHDQCMIYSEKVDQGLCVQGRKGCEQACLAGDVEKRGACSECEGKYEFCILSVEQAFQMMDCKKKKEQCKQVQQCDE